jgi:hypothetical protein
MSVRTTSSDPKVALYDSVTGFAFGPVFEDDDEIYRFLAWYPEHYEEDLRRLTDADWTQVLKAFADLEQQP